MGVALGRFQRNADTRRYLRRLFRLERDPERSFSQELQEKLDSDFPAHLHINLRASARQAGSGSQLMEAFFAQLRQAGISGVHVHCAARPVSFYEKNGFTVLGKTEFTPGVFVFCLGKRLRAL